MLNLNPATMTTHVVADHDEVVTQNKSKSNQLMKHKSFICGVCKKSV